MLNKPYCQTVQRSAICGARHRAIFTALSRGPTVRPVGKPEVMGLSEIAARLGVSKRYARELAGRKGFPDPTRLSQGFVWSTKDVEAWIARYRPQANEPRT
jgi:predicted DNA-binding transcriptional regulator AlpA